MKKPDKYNIGDTVTVKGIVYQDRVDIDGTVQCSFNAPNNALNKMKVTFCVAVDDIATHTPLPRPLQVGDTVKFLPTFNDEPADSTVTYKMLCIDGEEAWIKPSHGGNRFTINLDRVERV